ncbi:MAG: helix-turn-helix transcriptional regulator [Clostridiales bacterium]|nr:helix-turn-helix transcriptional regulator [Clostridiales bacterium]
MTVGEKIVKLRKEQNLTQEQFADMLKVSRQSVSKWELDSTYPDTEKLIRISKIFNCSLDYLLKDEVEQMDINIAAANEEAKENKIRAGILTYLSFPPIFGWIVGIISLKFQSDHMKNKVQIALTFLGMIFSLILTGLMVAGFLLEL